MKADRILLFNARKDLTAWLNEMFEILSEHDESIRKSKYTDYENAVHKVLDPMNEHEKLVWAENNIHVVLGFALAACAELQIDSCPISGFDKDSTREALNLNEDLEPVILLAIGYRDESDEAIKIPKWRFPMDKLFRKI